MAQQHAIDRATAAVVVVASAGASSDTVNGVVVVCSANTGVVFCVVAIRHSLSSLLRWVCKINAFTCIGSTARTRSSCLIGSSTVSFFGIHLDCCDGVVVIVVVCYYLVRCCLETFMVCFRFCICICICFRVCCLSMIVILILIVTAVATDVVADAIESGKMVRQSYIVYAH